MTNPRHLHLLKGRGNLLPGPLTHDRLAARQTIRRDIHEKVLDRRACGSSLLRPGANYGAPPAATSVVNTLSSSAAPRDGFTRLKLSLTSDESSTTEVVRLAGIALCSHSVCYESAAPGSVTLSSTANGSSTTVAELEVPFSDIASVRFKLVGGQGVLQGSVALPEPLKLERDFHGGDVLVVVQRRGAGYVPAAAAANYLQPEGTSLYYNPTFAMSAKLPHGVSISIPAGALSAPQVFIVGVHDTGDELPMVDIYPEVKLTKPATVELPAIQRAARALQSNQPPPTPRPQAVAPNGGLAPRAPAASATGPVRVEINATGYVRRKPQAPAASKPMNSSAVGQPTLEATVTAAATCNAAGWCNCADQLAFPANQLAIADGLISSGNE